MTYKYGYEAPKLTPENKAKLDAYNEAERIRVMKKLRKSDKWKLAQVVALNRMLLNGTCVIFKAPPVNIKRKVHKKDRA